MHFIVRFIPQPGSESQAALADNGFHEARLIPPQFLAAIAEAMDAGRTVGDADPAGLMVNDAEIVYLYEAEDADRARKEAKRIVGPDIRVWLVGTPLVAALRLKDAVVQYHAELRAAGYTKKEAKTAVNIAWDGVRFALQPKRGEDDRTGMSE